MYTKFHSLSISILYFNARSILPKLGEVAAAPLLMHVSACK